MRRLFFGLQDATGTAVEHVDYGSLRLWDAGVDWRSIEKAPGVYDWTHLDKLLHNALIHRVSVTLVVGGHTPACYGAPNTPPDPERFRAYATALMTRYAGGAIRTYSAWNEVNGNNFWGGSPGQMIELCRVLTEVRDAVNPSLRILSPSFQTSIPFQRRELRAFMANAWPLFDAIGVSLYPEVGTGPEAMIELAARCRLKLISAGVPTAMPLWGTEVNYDVGPNPATLLPDADQVSNVLRTYLLGATSGLSRLFWYRWDWGLVKGSPLANTYMTDPVDRVTPTPAGLALQTAMDWLDGDHDPVLSVDDDGTHRVTVRAHKATRVVAWNPETGARPKMIEGAAS